MLHTLRISGLIGLGPLEEKETTVGAMTSVVVSVERIVAVGYLGKKKNSKPSLELLWKRFLRIYTFEEPNWSAVIYSVVLM